MKSGYDPAYVQLLRSKQVTGTYELIEEFSRCMEKLETGKYEAPTAMKLPDGTWSLYLDYYGCRGKDRAMYRFWQTAWQTDISSGRMRNFPSHMVLSMVRFFRSQWRSTNGSRHMTGQIRAGSRNIRPVSEK